MLNFITLILISISFNAVLACEKTEHLKSKYVPLCAKRLETDIEHTSFLKETLTKAENQVMISTYDVSPKKLFDEGIGQAIIDAAERGVAIYVYYENRPYYSKEEYEDLCVIIDCCAKFEENANHSKCVIKDKDTAAIGSYNWLSAPRAGSSNGTLILTGGLVGGLIQDIWQGIRFYQSLAYDNERGVKKYLKDRDAFSIGEYQFAPGQIFYTLRTPEAHGLLLTDVLQKAKSSITLFSPFIRLVKLKETFATETLLNLQQRNIAFKIITLPEPCGRVPQEQGQIFAYLNGLCKRYSNFSYVIYPNFHSKTLMADDFICEGSFNWLSAVTNIEHDANNFEMSVGIRGEIACSMIQCLEKTQLGKTILQKSQTKQLLPSKTVKSPEANIRQQPAIMSNNSGKRSKIDEPGQHYESKKKTKISPSIPVNFDDVITIYSGEKYGIDGYCIRFNGGDYLRDKQGNIAYFITRDEAKWAAYENSI